MEKVGLKLELHASVILKKHQKKQSPKRREFVNLVTLVHG
jgi:hypothetical protein